MSQILIKDEHDTGVADFKTEGNAANILVYEELEKGVK